MKTHRFFIGNPLTLGTLTIESADIARQLSAVLKIRVGEKIVLFNGTGAEAVASVLKYHKRAVVCHVESIVEKKESVRNTTLYLAIIKNESLEFAIQKATEIGVAKIVPLLTHRTEKKAVNSKRLWAIAKEAAEQSGRVRLPEITEPVAFQEAAKIAIATNQKVFFCDFAPQALSEVDFKNASSATLFIGPEGGWDEAERALAKEANLITRSLGTTVLRADTAATVASYLAINL